MTSAPPPAILAAADVVSFARALVGATFLVDGAGGVIVETEAYRADDPASHSFNGPTRRNAPMFGPAGCAYVYRSYGLHWCFNITGGETGSAVLVRSLAPTIGLDAMRARRAGITDRLLCAGPGRLCAALGITDGLNGARLDRPPFVLRPADGDVPLAIGRRIGITKAADAPWRFGLAGSPFVSRPFRDVRS